MYKIYFENNKIINISNENNNIDLYKYYINLFNINVSKTIQKTIKVQTTDLLGRVILNNNLPIYHDEIINKEVNLNMYSQYFTIEDIFNSKINQLKQQFNCTNVLLDELYNNNNIFGFNTNIGQNSIIINNEITSNIITSNYDNILIYSESDNSNNNLEYYISYDKLNFIKLNNDFNKINNKSFYLKIKSNTKININSIGICFK